MVGFLLFAVTMLAQTVVDTTLVDNRYREDQFYFGITYNSLANKPTGASQSGFPTGFHLGFIRDTPINKRRNVAVGLGLGISTNSYISNIIISEFNGNVSYNLIDPETTTFSKNKFTTYLIEVPLEFRWRTSTTKNYKFWRIYTGVKFGYLLYNSTKFRGSLGNIDTSNTSDFNKFQYGLTLSVGYSTFNIHLYYGLNSILKDNARLNTETIKMSALKIGLITYIL